MRSLHTPLLRYRSGAELCFGRISEDLQFVQRCTARTVPLVRCRISSLFESSQGLPSKRKEGVICLQTG